MSLDEITSLVTIIGVILAFLTILQASMLNSKARQPAVVVAAHFNPSVPETIEVSIKNYGPTVAEDIELFSAERPLRPQHFGEDTLQPLEIFDRKWTLAPGQEWRTVWGQFSTVKEINSNHRMRGHAECYGQGRPWYRLWVRKRLKFKYVLDLTAYDDRTYMDEHTIHRVGKNVEQILERMGGPTNRVRRTIKGDAVTLDEAIDWLGPKFEKFRPEPPDQ